MPTPAGDYEGTVSAIAALIERAERELGMQCPVGIGTPGAISEHGTIKNANSVVLNGRPLKADLERALAREIRMSNDANCFALSESFDGAGTGCSVVFGVILGTGTGGGIAVNGQIIEGANAIAGEWGHNPLPWPRAHELPGPPCYCGKSGCMETFLSGPALARDYGSGPFTAQSIIPYADRLARGLASVINILDPQIVVLGGGVSNIAALYDALPGLLKTYAFSDTVRTQISRAAHGDSSGVRGAALLCS